MSKRKLSQQEEFHIMTLVLDKFLWLGTVIMGWGLYKAVTINIQEGLYFILAGAIVLFLFMWVIIKEFEFLR